MKAHLRRIRISPKKANIVAGLIRQQEALKAMNILNFTPKKSAKIIKKVLTSAIANAENNDGQKPEQLRVKQVIVNKGPFYKRYLPSTRGRALPLKKPTAHISIELEKITA